MNGGVYDALNPSTHRGSNQQLSAGVFAKDTVGFKNLEGWRLGAGGWS